MHQEQKVQAQFEGARHPTSVLLPSTLVMTVNPTIFGCSSYGVMSY